MQKACRFMGSLYLTLTLILSDETSSQSIFMTIVFDLLPSVLFLHLDIASVVIVSLIFCLRRRRWAAAVGRCSANVQIIECHTALFHHPLSFHYSPGIFFTLIVLFIVMIEFFVINFERRLSKKNGQLEDWQSSTLQRLSVVHVSDVRVIRRFHSLSFTCKLRKSAHHSFWTIKKYETAEGRRSALMCCESVFLKGCGRVCVEWLCVWQGGGGAVS